ncbi:MAG: hypothetical protein SP4CHLAM5_10310 [Chlamydiia bacterium]|nr:hypothetical protein [Chlamydiia bacterium]MCH9618888.1 hypothetical protein [Chlamydiia bacterium]MCH9624555.1 hypothetical protein [Chlamydiia bacterium]
MDYINNNYFNYEEIDYGIDPGFCEITSFDYISDMTQSPMVMDIGAIFGLAALAIGGMWSGLINSNDASTGFCDLTEEDDSLAIQYLNVERSVLTNNPLSCLKSISQVCTSDLKFEVNFVGEAGVDAGGLTKELFSLLFASLLSKEDGSSRDIFSFSKEELSEHGLTAQEFYTIIFTDIFDFIRKQDSLLIENIVDGDLLDGVLGLPVEGLLRKSSGQGEGNKFLTPDGKQMMLAACSLLNDRTEEASVCRMNRKCLAFLTGKAVDFSEIERLAQAIEDLEDHKLVDLQKDKKNYMTFVRTTIEQHILGQFQVRSQNLLELALLEIESGKKRDAATMLAGVQAPFDTSSIIDSIVLSDSVQKQDKIALENKIILLKKGLETIATVDEVRLFAQFVTGSAILMPHESIKIGACIDSTNYISVSSCFNLLLLEPSTVKDRDDTAEGLLRAVLSNMQDASFTTR